MKRVYLIFSSVNLKTVMRNSGYNDSVIAEVCTALSILAKYGILGIGFGLNTANPAVNCFNIPALDQTNNTSTTNNVLGAIGQINLDSYMGAVSPSTGTSLEGLEMFRSSTMQPNAPLALNNNNFSISGNQSVQPNFNKTMLTPETTSKEKNVEIPEVIVGAILGKHLFCQFKNFQWKGIIYLNMYGIRHRS